MQVLAANSIGFFVAGIALQYLGSGWTIGLFAGFLMLLFVLVAFNEKLGQISIA
jgi:hypothetical protein